MAANAGEFDDLLEPMAGAQGYTLEQRVDRELGAFRLEPALRMYTPEGEPNDPLVWWQEKENALPTRSICVYPPLLLHLRECFLMLA